MASANTDDRLQQYFDGELSAEDAENVRREIAEAPELSAKVEGLAHLRSLVKTSAEATADDLDSEALWGAISARMGDQIVDDEPMFPTETPAERPALGVVTGGKKEEPKKRSRSVVWVSFGATLAAAAAVLMLVLRPFDTVPETPPAPPPGSEIVEVDFGYSTGAIFSVEQEGARYAVIWISDEKPEVDQRIQ
jgi:hypothetical protein